MFLSYTDGLLNTPLSGAQRSLSSDGLLQFWLSSLLRVLMALGVGGLPVRRSSLAR